MADDADGANPDDTDVFIYTTGSIVPRDVVRVRVHPSVTVIPARAFYNRVKLEEVELLDGLLEIGNCAFYNCTSLKRMKIPSTVTIIDDFAFYKCCQLEEVELCEGLLEIGREAFDYCKSLKRINLPTTIRSIGAWSFSETTSSLSINLPDGVEGIGSYAFFRGTFFTFRIPPLITTIPQGMVEQAVSLFSVELSESVTHLGSCAFEGCYSLRNLAIPTNATIELMYEAFRHCTDLQQLFGSEEQIINALKHRFDNLPIHKMLYYQSYQPVSVEQLNNATNMRSGQSRALRIKLDPTGKQQDCLGMTPLHILACSTVQNLELYQVLVKKYPENLITEDGWGALPLLYAVWGNAPSEIVQYLVQSYKSIYPDYEFNWTKMVETLSLANVPKEVIQKLVDVQKDSFPEQGIDWDVVVEACTSCTRVSTESFLTLVFLRNLERIKTIGLKQWRDEIREYIFSNILREYIFSNASEMSNRREFITKVEAKLVQYETEYQKLKDSTSLIELALWKIKMNDRVREEKQRRNKKRVKSDNSSVREQSRISCGANIVIQHMLPYLVCPPVAPSSEDDSNGDENSISGSDDESESSVNSDATTNSE